MAYDEKLADRVRDVLEEEDGVTERKMFGGLAFMGRGHMACGSSRDAGVAQIVGVGGCVDGAVSGDPASGERASR